MISGAATTFTLNVFVCGVLPGAESFTVTVTVNVPVRSGRTGDRGTVGRHSVRQAGHRPTVGRDSARSGERRRVTGIHHTIGQVRRSRFSRRPGRS